MKTTPDLANLNEEACAAFVFFLSNPTPYTQKKWKFVEDHIRTLRIHKRNNDIKRHINERKLAKAVHLPSATH